MGDLETAALSGSLFRPRSHSPARSTSTPSPSNPEDELASDLSGPSSPITFPTRDGPQTGPKGVIADRRAHKLQSRLEREQATRALVNEQEKRSMVAMTVHEEDEERERERLLEDGREDGDGGGEDVARWRRARREELERENTIGDGRRGGGSVKRGGLRQIGREGFVVAAERPGWVVVLIYEPVRRPLSSTKFSLMRAGRSPMPRPPKIPPATLLHTPSLLDHSNPTIPLPSRSVRPRFLAAAERGTGFGCFAHDVGL